MYNGSRVADEYSIAAQRPDNTAHLIKVDQFVHSQNPAAFLVGGYDLAFEGLRTLLIKHSFEVAGVGKRLSEIDVSAVEGARQFLVIIDVAEGSLFPLDDILLFRQDFPHACIVALVDNAHERIGELRINISANNAILDRNMACDALIKALNVVMAGYGVLSPMIRLEPAAGARAQNNPKLDAAATSPQAVMPANLSDRELQIIGCIAEGQSNKVIARRFSISEATVKIHVRGILRKVDARNRTQAAIWAIHHGFGSSAIPLD